MRGVFFVLFNYVSFFGYTFSQFSFGFFVPNPASKVWFWCPMLDDLCVESRFGSRGKHVARGNGGRRLNDRRMMNDARYDTLILCVDHDVVDFWVQAFRVVNKEWEYSHKKGFKCTFERGILHVYFNFKRYRYRR